MSAESLVETIEVDSSAIRPKWQMTLAALSIVFAAMTAVFYKAIFLGKPIAKLGTLPNIDALFNPALKQAIVNIGKDPSGYLIFFPNGHFEEAQWSKLVPPLWNPNIACGFPNFADPQAMMHSPAHLLGLFSSPQAYNAGLLLEIALGGAGMFLLARALKSSLPASIFAALAFILSPCILLQVDIGNNESFFPWIFLAFVWMTRTPSFLRAAIVGVLCALLAFSAHPETTFFAVLFAAIFSFFLQLGKQIRLPRLDASAPVVSKLGLPLGDEIKNAKTTVFGVAVHSIGLLFVTALVSLGVAAPLIFPFAEFMKDAHFYKDANSAVFMVSVQSFLEGYFVILGDNPYFIGAVAAFLVPLGLFWRIRVAIPLLVTFLIAFSICVPVGPIAALLSQKPFSAVATLYGVPELIIMLALFAGFGFDRLWHKMNLRESSVLLLSALAVVILPLIYLSNGANGFMQVWRASHNTLTASSIFGFLGLLVCILGSTKVRLLKPIAILVLLSLNFASLAMASRTALPNNPPFSIEPNAPLAFLKSKGERSLAIGSNFFLCNSNLDFGIQDFRCFSPLLPKRYASYLTAAGAKCYNLYFYVFPDTCSHLLDLASVKYVMSRDAVRAEGEQSVSRVNLGSALNGRLIPGLRVLDSEFYYDSLNSQIDADMSWRIHDQCNYKYALQYCIYDAAGKEIWSGRELIISPAAGPEHLSKTHDSFPVPKNASFPLSFCVKVKDTWISQFVSADENQKRLGDAFLLCKVPTESKAAGKNKIADDQHFKLIAEYPSENCRIYENQQSLPVAYLTSNVEHLGLNSGEEVLAKIADKSFDGHTNTFVEDNPKEGVRKSDTGNTSHIIPVQIERPDCNTVSAQCDAESDSYLVLTDAYYPGWKCYVDGVDTPIVRANYLFRAVPLKKGAHQIKFQFVPKSYYDSMLLSACIVLGVLAWAVARRKELRCNQEPV